MTGDNVGGVNVKMKCDDSTEIDLGGYNIWGTWDSSTFKQCPSSTYFCGVQAMIEPGNKLAVWAHDDKGMTKIKFLCCKNDSA